MWHRVAGDAVLVVHLLFLGFMVGGVFLAWRWPRVIWVQLTAMAYGAAPPSPWMASGAGRLAGAWNQARSA